MSLGDVQLKEIQINNFKCHEKETIVAGENRRTEIYGENRQGKTAVLEALKFCLTGTINDVHKIKLGEDKMSVKAVFKELGTGTAVEIERSLIKKEAGKPIQKLKVLYDGLEPQKPASFIKDLVSVGTFNPRELLAKEGRLGRLLNLIPLSIKKEDLGDIWEYVHNKGGVDWAWHAFQVLSFVEGDLRNVRLSLHQTKEREAKHYEKESEECRKFQTETKERFGDPEKLGYEEVLKEAGAREQKDAQFKEKISELAEEKVKTEDREISLDLEIKTLGDSIKKKELEIEKERLAVKSKKEALVSVREAIKSLKEREEKAIKYGNEKELEDRKFQERLDKAKAYKKVKDGNDKLLKLKGDVDRAVATWKAMDELIKKDLKDLKKKILDPLTKKIDELGFEEGELLWKGRVIDELSESELIELAVRFKTLDKNCRFIGVDGYESVTKKTSDGIPFGDRDVFVINVGDKKLGEEWKGVRIKTNGV